DDLGYGQILSTENRAAIAKGKTPKVDDAWIKVFPEDAGLKGERIPMHHVQGSPLTVPPEIGVRPRFQRNPYKCLTFL
ncbi:hypothetical protein, partial [Pseudomonas sp. RL_105y_Pfl1_103]|uniref:hypothetical protein n=1 Tax=Pseudomonas sp. RL_105y_Pfl1_103 TaxID=3088707 RepID=UPI0030D8B076